MIKDFRGDTFFRSYSIELDNEIYKFQNGDKIKVAFYKFNNEALLLKEKELVAGETQVDIVWSADEMSNLKIGDYILETEITAKDFTKTHQETIKIYEDFIQGEE